MSSTPHGARYARRRAHRLLAGVGCALAMCVAAAPAQADGWHHGHGGAGRPGLVPGALLLSTSDYAPANITPGVTQLPPGCGSTADALHARDRRRRPIPSVFNNDQVDGIFGVTSPIFLDELTPWGQVFNRIPVPTRDLVTSFSSKSELALNLSTNGQYVTVHGLRRASGGTRRVERQHARRDRLYQPGDGRLLSCGRRPRA